eukprot:scaffold187744_cov18-Tisochrysis_lutea.AAC.1
MAQQDKLFFPELMNLILQTPYLQSKVDYFIAIEGNDRGCGKTDVSITSVVASVGKSAGETLTR